MNQKPSNWLNQYAHNIHSQHGEDGILAKILEHITYKDFWCVEFGAWDGLFLSNTAHLIQRSGYSAVLIEPDEDRFEDIKHNYSDREKVIVLKEFVGIDSDDNLDVILKNTPIPQNFDLLSIDIDGNDYHVWDTMTYYQPKVIIIEFNPTIPNPVEFIQPRDVNVSQGSSAKALNQLAKSKGYELVACTHTNLIFVDEQYFANFDIVDNSLDRIHTDDSAVTYVFNGMDGTVFVRGRGALLWWPIHYQNSIIQPLPKRLRMHPSLLTGMHKVLVRLYVSIYNDRFLLKFIRRILRLFGLGA